MTKVIDKPRITQVSDAHSVDQIAVLAGVRKGRVLRALRRSRLLSRSPENVCIWIQDLRENRRMRAGSTKTRSRTKWSIT